MQARLNAKSYDRNILPKDINSKFEKTENYILKWYINFFQHVLFSLQNGTYICIVLNCHFHFDYSKFVKRINIKHSFEFNLFY